MGIRFIEDQVNKVVLYIHTLKAPCGQQVQPQTHPGHEKLTGSKQVVS